MPIGKAIIVIAVALVAIVALGLILFVQGLKHQAGKQLVLRMTRW